MHRYRGIMKDIILDMGQHFKRKDFMAGFNEFY
jgi:hypothetical protein